MKPKNKLTDIPGVGAVREHLLQQAGYYTIEDIAGASVQELANLFNDTNVAAKISSAAQNIVCESTPEIMFGLGLFYDFLPEDYRNINKIRERLDERATRELISEGLIRVSTDGNNVWTERGMVDAWKSYMKWHLCVLGIKELRRREG